MSNIGILEFAEGRYNEAKQMLGDALEIRKKHQKGWGSLLRAGSSSKGNKTAPPPPTPLLATAPPTKQVVTSKGDELIVEVCIQQK
jgi:hypothetical protein